MILNIFNWPKISISKNTLINSLEQEFATYKISQINIVFVSSKEIQKLNKEFRNIDSVTDVLSFNLDEPSFLGEVYICSEYIRQTIGEENCEKEIVRVLIHGLLHLLGYDHTTKLEEKENQEEMFVKQEQILENVYKDII